MQLLGIPGSVRAGSHNTSLLHAARAVLPPGATMDLWSSLKEIPPFDEDDEAAPPAPAVAALREALAEADAVLFATPEYNGSVPGVLKNALDWASRPWATHPLRNKPVAVIGASTGAFGAAWAQAELRRILGAMGARVLESDVAVGHAPTLLDAAGELVDDALRQRLAEVAEGLVTAAAARAVNAHATAA